MPVGNNEHQRIDEVSTEVDEVFSDLSYGIQPLESFSLWPMNFLIVLSKCHKDCLLVMTWPSDVFAILEWLYFW